MISNVDDTWAWLGKAVALLLFAGALTLLATSGGIWPPYGSGPVDEEDEEKKKK